VREIVLNGAEWNSEGDVYTSFFRAVGAPPWHGQNFDALIDSIETGQINAVEVPYRVVIQNYSLISPDARQMASDFVDLLHEIAARGCRVEIRVEDSN
jgi:RNAse (barnase) inhibitor barstar